MAAEALDSLPVYFSEPLRARIPPVTNLTFLFCISGREKAGYGWTLVSDSLQLNYICEISLADSSNIGIEERGEGTPFFGLFGIRFNVCPN